MSDKIKISLEDINSSQVDNDLKRQEILTRMHSHQQTVHANMTPQQAIGSQRGDFFRKGVVYMSLFGLVFSLIAWGLGEYLSNYIYNNDLTTFAELFMVAEQFKDEGATDEQIIEFFENARKSKEFRYNPKEFRYNPKEFRYNPYLQDDLTEEKAIRLREKDEKKLKWLNQLWYIFIAMFIAIGLSIAECVINQNWGKMMKNFVLGAILGIIGGYFVSLFVDDFYFYLGGGNEESSLADQVFARSVGWAVIGTFVAIAPGILMMNAKKFFLGLLGGLTGGFIGGLLFDAICRMVDGGTGGPARMVGILSFGILAGVATALFENVAKQGWLKIKVGLIAGKQFILYKNPTTIGSSPKCDIYLFKDPTVAGIHAAIHEHDGRYILCSQVGTTTFVNTNPVQECTLKNGDLVQIGSTVMLFETKKVD